MSRLHDLWTVFRTLPYIEHFLVIIILLITGWFSLQEYIMQQKSSNLEHNIFVYRLGYDLVISLIEQYHSYTTYSVEIVDYTRCVILQHSRYWNYFVRWSMIDCLQPLIPHLIVIQNKLDIDFLMVHVMFRQRCGTVGNTGAAAPQTKSRTA